MGFFEPAAGGLGTSASSKTYTCSVSGWGNSRRIGYHLDIWLDRDVVLVSQCNSKKTRPTKRALDAGDSAAFTSSFPRPSPPGQAGFEFILLPGRVHARPPAGNAHRWAVR
jgi:hypothetical protein